MTEKKKSENLKSKLESLIFAFGKPITLKKLQKILGTSETEIYCKIEELRKEYKENDRGIHLVLTKDTVEMVTNPNFAKEVSELTTFELEEKLSSAALETMAIIAYRGPITRVEIEMIRGVNCVYTLRNLSIRGLVLKKQNPGDARKSIYEISEKFLKHCGLTHETDLPNFSELSKKTSFEEYIEQKEVENEKKILKSVNRE